MVEVGQVWASKIDDSLMLEVVDINKSGDKCKVKFPKGNCAEVYREYIIRKYDYVGRKEEGYNPIEEIKNLYK